VSILSRHAPLPRTRATAVTGAPAGEFSGPDHADGRRGPAGPRPRLPTAVAGNWTLPDWPDYVLRVYPALARLTEDAQLREARGTETSRATTPTSTVQSFLGVPMSVLLVRRARAATVDQRRILGVVLHSPEATLRKRRLQQRLQSHPRRRIECRHQGLGRQGSATPRRAGSPRSRGGSQPAPRAAALGNDRMGIRHARAAGRTRRPAALSCGGSPSDGGCNEGTARVAAPASSRRRYALIGIARHRFLVGGDADNCQHGVVSDFRRVEPAPLLPANRAARTPRGRAESTPVRRDGEGTQARCESFIELRQSLPARS
jgi:hypothetical protein